MKYLFSLILSTTLLSLAAQVEEDSIVSEILNVRKVRPYVEAEYGFGALSNRASTIEFIDFFSSDFLTKEDKEELLNSIDGTLRFGYLGHFKIGYYEPGYKALDIYKEGKGFSINYQYYNSGKLSPDLLKLMLYGNGPYANQTLNLGNTKYEVWNYTTLNYHFDLKLDSLPPINFTVGINVGHEYTFYKVWKGDLYTEQNGAYLDMDVDYRLRDRSNETEVIAGLGLNLGATTSFDLSKKEKLTIGVEDFGFILWTNGRMVDADSTFRFGGVDVGNVLTVTDSIFDAAKGAYQDAFYYNQSGEYARMTPFKVAATYIKKLNKGKLDELVIEGQYRYLAGYYPKLSFGTVFKFGRRQHLNTALSVGGYNIGGIDVGYQWQFSRLWNLNLMVTNISGLLIPTLPGGAFGMIRLSYDL